MERSVHWRGASPAPVRITLWVTAATCVPQDTTTSQNALVSLLSKRFAGFIAFFSWWKKCTILILLVKFGVNDLLLWSISACACETSTGGSADNNCDVETGQCPCQLNFAGKECNQCAHGYYNYPACTCESMTSSTKYFWNKSKDFWQNIFLNTCSYVEILNTYISYCKLKDEIWIWFI